MRAKLEVTRPSSRVTASLSIRSAKKAMSSGRSSRIARKLDLRRSSARSALSADVGERDLRLDHPELGEVPAGVRVLGPERRPERVDVGQGQAVGLDVELAGDGEEGRLAEEVLRVVDRALGRAREVGQVERRDPEELAGALGVAGGDDRRVDPVEAVLVEVAVDRHGQAVPDPGHRAEGVRARPQVGDLAEVLERVALGRDGVGVRDRRPSRPRRSRRPGAPPPGPGPATRRPCR